MFLRKIRPRGRGRRQEYWVLLESYRTAKGSRHRVVAYLGKLPQGQLSGWTAITARLNGQAPAQPALFARPEPIGEEPKLVDVRHIRLKDLRSFGPEFVGWALWRLLGLDELLSAHMPAGEERAAWWSGLGLPKRGCRGFDPPFTRLNIRPCKTITCGA